EEGQHSKQKALSSAKCSCKTATVEISITARYSKLTDRRMTMNNEVLKEMIAKLLEDARRIQEVEPNAGTQSRIDDAMKLLKGE
ncbi:hypothetical protein PV941_11055, partial [Ligilactobacillus salivarius]|nr:hypothetical protein [Ligilactobacillus salivarius]